MRLEHMLRLNGCIDRIHRAREGDEERIALCANNTAMMLVPHVAQELIVFCDHRRKFISQVLQEAGGAFDIGK
jgi:hypothetical protein